MNLPVAGVTIESWSLVTIDGGLAVAWMEYHGSEIPSRTLRLAHVTIP